MWIVRLALRRMYTFVVMSLVIALLGVMAIFRTSTDIFPDINIPVISVVWNYPGLSTTEMEQQITIFSEFSTSFAVANIKNIESQTINGVAVVKFYFHPGTDIAEAQAQITAVSQTVLGRMPPGTDPPLVMRFNASSVPILQLSVSSDTLTESQLYDFALYQIRQQLAVVQGTTLTLPYGGAPRQIMVDLNPQALLAYGLSAQDVNEAVSAQNLTLPTGTAKMGQVEYTVSLNSSPDAVATLNDIPIRQVNGATVYIRDVAQVRDGPAVQTSVVRRNGRPAVLVTILKNGDTSTLAIANQVKELLPTVQAAAPRGVKVELISDQSTFVSGAVHGVVVEGLIAASLTAILILLFLGSWRSTLIVATSIPLSIFVAIVTMSALGQTINLMTLGGLALAVGILVDDATVEIENVHRNLGLGKPLTRAILDGAQQIAVPAFVATLSISIVFLSVLFLDGVARYLFIPMGMAVAFSVMASYFLSRTVVPTMIKFLLKSEVEQLEASGPHSRTFHGNIFARTHRAFNRRFDRFRTSYVGGLNWALCHRAVVFIVFGILVGVTAVLVPFVGRDFFPSVDAGQIRMQVKAPPGTRIEETERYFTQVGDAVRRVIPEQDIELVLDNIGVPDRINLAVTESSTISSADGEILVSLSHDREGSTPEYVEELRAKLPREFPHMSFAFKPADMATQILNFGLPAPIDVQVTGLDREATYKAAREIEGRLRSVPGATDVYLHQIVDAPRLHVAVDRVRSLQVGLTQRDVANSVLVSLASSRIVTPNYWTDPNSGRNYPVAVQTPPFLVDSINQLQTTGLSVSGNEASQLLGDLATIERRTMPVVANHSNIQPTFNVRAAVQGTDLGTVGGALSAIVEEVRGKLPPGNGIVVRGQLESMDSAFWRLGLGLVFAVALVYFLIVVNFQSWLDPFIIITALPGAMVGIVWMLFLTETTFNVPSLMGAIMCVGVATSNSILMVTFANSQRLEEGKDAIAAALAAGQTRLRPVIMTALAMIIGMLPMSLGLGEGGEQNAPLGRAVIGGLIVATIATLFFVPVVYSILRRKQPEIEHDPDLEGAPAEPQPKPRAVYSAAWHGPGTPPGCPSASERSRKRGRAGEGNERIEG